MVFYLYAKNYKKRSNSSKDIAIRRIEQSDWPRELFKFYEPLTSCKISEKTNEPILRKTCNGRTDGLTSKEGDDLPQWMI